jgi:hypothetical protein
MISTKRELGVTAIAWCRLHFGISKDVTINFEVKKKGQPSDCWGYCKCLKKGQYIIKVDGGQSMRDFIATVVHEVIHVNQWESDTWEGDGESEAEQLQYTLTDKMWQMGIL